MGPFTDLPNRINGIGSLAQVLGLGIVGSLLIPLAAGAVEFPDGRVAFDLPPYFNDASTPYPTVFYPDPIYYFVLSLSPQAGKSLERVVIKPLTNQEAIYFVPSRTQAFGQQPRDRQFPLGSVTVNPETYDLTITFQPPIPPGEVITLAISPNRNPALDGVYQFGITAFPVGGDKAIGQQIGTARLTFYRGGDSR